MSLRLRLTARPIRLGPFRFHMWLTRSWGIYLELTIFINMECLSQAKGLLLVQLTSWLLQKHSVCSFSAAIEVRFKNWMKIAGTWPLKSLCFLLASSCNCWNTKKVWCIQFPVRLTYSLSVSGGGTLHRCGLTGVWGKCYLCKISHNSCRASRILAEEHKQEHHIELYMPMLTLFSLSFGVGVGWAGYAYNNRH